MHPKDKLLWDTIDLMLKKAEEINMDVVVHATDAKDVLLMINKKSKKVLIISVVSDLEKSKRYKIETMIVNFKRWRWAEDEGFTFDQIVGDKILSSEIFCPVETNDINILK